MLSPGLAPRDPCPQPGVGWVSCSRGADSAGAAALSRAAGLGSPPSCSKAQTKKDKISRCLPPASRCCAMMGRHESSSKAQMSHKKIHTQSQPFSCGYWAFLKQPLALTWKLCEESGPLGVQGCCDCLEAWARVGTEVLGPVTDLQSQAREKMGDFVGVYTWRGQCLSLNQWH